VFGGTGGHLATLAQQLGRDKILRRILQIFSKRFVPVELSGQDVNWFAVAEDNELAGIFDYAETAAPHLVQKFLAPDQSLDIADLASDGPAFSYAFGREQVDDPFLRRNDFRQLAHAAPPAATLPKQG
jgi:hypothetical protein